MWNNRWLVLLVLSRCVLDCLLSPEPTAPTNVESGADFLQNVMNHLHSERMQQEIGESLNRISDMGKVVNYPSKSPPAPVDDRDPLEYTIMGPTPLPSNLVMNHNSVATGQLHSNVEQLVADSHVPPPPLSKAELAALYQAAVNKGASLASMAAATPGVAAGLHELKNLLASAPSNTATKGTIPGYYYYFYPIKSFMKDSGKPATQHKEESHGHPDKHENNEDPHHAMKHMVPTALMVMEGGDKSVEPLFMAVAGFIGMTLMFVASVLFLPKLGNLRSRGISAIKNAPEELAGLTKLVFEAIDGKDCSERLVCEVGRVVRKMQIDNKPIRILEILLPSNLGKRLQQVRKSATKREKCNFIPCKWKRNRQ